MAVAAWDLTTVAKVKDLMKKTDAKDDDLIQTLITNVSAGLEMACKIRHFKSDSYAEYYDGCGPTWIMLRQRPIISVSLLTHNGVTIDPAAADDYTCNDGYCIKSEEGLLVYAPGFYSGVRNVYVEYEAGFAAGHEMLAKIERVVGKEVVWAFHDYIHNKNPAALSDNRGGYLLEDWLPLTQTFIKTYKYRVFA